jgi:hypothetical protein
LWSKSSRRNWAIRESQKRLILTKNAKEKSNKPEALQQTSGLWFPSSQEVQVPENGSKDMRQPATLRKVETSDKWQPYAVGMKDVGARIHAKGQRQEDGDGLTERVRRILTFKKAKTAYLQMEGDIAGAKSVEGLWTRAVKAGWGAGSAGAVTVADFWHAVAADRVPSFQRAGTCRLGKCGRRIALDKERKPHKEVHSNKKYAVVTFLHRSVFKKPHKKEWFTTSLSSCLASSSLAFLACLLLLSSLST